MIFQINDIRLPLCYIASVKHYLMTELQGDNTVEIPYWEDLFHFFDEIEMNLFRGKKAIIVSLPDLPESLNSMLHIYGTIEKFYNEMAREINMNGVAKIGEFR